MKRNLAARSSAFCLHPPGSSLHIYYYICNSTTEGENKEQNDNLEEATLMSGVTKLDSQLRLRLEVTWRRELGCWEPRGHETGLAALLRQVTCSGGNCCPDTWIEVSKVMGDKKLQKSN